MQYLTIAIIVFLLLTAVSIGWYWLFKRHEQRMNERFDDLVSRANPIPGLFGAVIEYQHKYYQELETILEQHAQKQDRQEELLLGIKHDLFLDYLKTRTEGALEKGDVSQEEYARFREMLESFKLDNYSKS